MGPLIVVEFVICGICLAIGLLHLAIFIFRSERKVDLLFAIMSFGAAGAAFFEASMYRAISPGDFIAAFKAQITFQGIIWIALIWFIAEYTGTTRRWLAVAVTAGYALAILVNLTSPFGIIYSGIDALKTATLPWGETITTAVASANPWRFLPDVAWVGLMYLAGESCIRLSRRGQRRRALFLGISLLVFLGLAYLHGTLGDLGIFGPPSLFTFTFMGLILIMSASITRDVVRAPELSREVEANERLWRSFLENVQLLVVGLDRAGRVTHINPFFTQLTGFTELEMLGQDWFGPFLPESDRTQLKGVFQQALEAGVPPHFQNKILTKSGEDRVIYWSNVGLSDSSGRLTGTLSVGKDITDRERAVQDLADERERMDIVLSALNTGLALINPDMTVAWVNAKMREMFPWDDPVGQKCYAFCENRTEVCEGCQSVQAFEDGQIHERELLNTKNNRWYYIIALPIKDAAGRVIGVLESNTDSTERKLTEERLRTSEEKFREFFANTPDYCFIISPEGTILDVNVTALRVLDYEREALVGKPLLTLYAPESLPQAQVLFDRWQAGGQIRNEEMIIATRHGAKHTVLLNAGVVKDPSGKILYSASVQTDITDFKRAAAERDKAMQELEALKARIEAENIYLREELENHSGFKEIVGNSNALFYVLEKVRQVAETDAIVLIQGETGVGKELIARAIHQTGNRASRPFIQVNCAALPANLIESELFGHEAGAFTGATQRRRGRFELADGGTLLLDEISELPLELQPKLLRVLQEGQFERVGGSRTQAVSVRIIAATNRDLKEEVRAGRFRADLYYRLNVFPITVPPLRRRREDIPLLVHYFIPKISLQVGKTVDQIPPHVMEQLVAGDWPGNVRELKNVLERAVISSAGTVLSPLEGFLSKSDDKPSAPDPATDEPTGLDELQRRHIIRILRRTKGRIEGAGGAAELLEINASTLRARIRKVGITRQQYL